MNRVCPVCSQSKTKEQGAYRGRHATFQGMHRQQCPDCGMVFAAPMPSEPALMDFNARYFDSAHGGHTMDLSALAFFAGIARLRADHLSRYLAARSLSAGRVLEVGPGPGHFARAWRERHPGTVYFALETDATCHESLRALGVHVLSGSGAEPVDLVVASHVLEHVSDPRGFLQSVTRDLQPGGALFIEVPCQDWRHKSLDEPHLLFFDKPPMERLLADLGFTQIQLSYHGREITEMNSANWWRTRWEGLRARMIARGVVAPFDRSCPGMEALAEPLQRAVIAPYRAHVETSRPAWWLRALAVKRTAP